MRVNGYLSERFNKIIWPRFSVEFKNDESKRVYLVDIGQFAEFIHKDVLDATQRDADLYMNHL